MDQLFHAGYLQYCQWFTASGSVSCFEDVAYSLAAEAIAHREASHWALYGMRLWKRGFLRKYLRRGTKTVRFVAKPAQLAAMKLPPGTRIAAWAGKAGAVSNVQDVVRVEDGFLRSPGLGAALVPPVSLAFDDLGIYYDPAHPSRLENLIAKRASLSKPARRRAADLRTRILSERLSKYNLGGTPASFDAGGREVVLVPGQVEDDASILKGAVDIRTNLDLLRAVRSGFPDACILYKTHPDVRAGLRDGAVPVANLSGLTDAVVDDVDIADLLDQVDRVATITSLTGFEALLRRKKVSCFGVPFYAGWGLTDDRAPVPDRRGVAVGLDGLVHAALIDYPRYWDPRTGTSIAVEEALDLLSGPSRSSAGPGLRSLAKAQGALASLAYLWR